MKTWARGEWVRRFRGRCLRALAGVMTGAARGSAIFLGAFALLNSVVGWSRPGFDVNLWWIDVSFLSPGIARVGMTLAGAVMFAYGLGWRRFGVPRLAPWVFLALAGVIALNTIDYYRLRAAHAFYAGGAVPLTLLLVPVFVLMAHVAWRERRTRRSAAKIAVVAAMAMGVVGLPLAQMYCFGSTDYRRQADVIVVFGARAYASGWPSTALADRVRTACVLYREGWAPRLLFSGGAGDGAIHETEAMRRFAVRLGVPNEAIILDPQGINTHATVRNTTRLCAERRWRRALAVSHSYHLPRVKMDYRRVGWEVYTVPVVRPYPLPGMQWMVGREIVALWKYYLLPGR